MCGIYGIAKSAEFSEKDISSSVDMLKHRGPDDSGIHIQGHLGVGMCRLSINELATGHQPFVSKDGSKALVFNGEIYNYKLLTQQLGLPEHTSEAELIMNLFESEGTSFIDELDGMFAIAIVNFRSESVSLFRDPFGKKPLWIYLDKNGDLEFASEIKAIKSPKTLREEFVSEYLTFGYVPFGKSPYNEIKSISPGSYAVWQKGSLKEQRYWTLKQTAKNVKIDYEVAKSEVRNLISKAVEKRLISERPIGVYLSGGYDSSVIAAVMKQSNNSKVNSYSIGFKNVAFDESIHAKRVAAHVNTNHHEKILDSDIAELVREIFQKVDLPFADSSIIPTYYLNHAASKEIVVALGGDGGDEIFGGYDRYKFIPLIRNLHWVLRFFPQSLPGKSKRILLLNRKLRKLRDKIENNQSFGSQYRNFVSLLKNDELQLLLKVPISTAIEDFAKQVDDFNATSLRKMLLSDVNNYLLDDLLVKADLASMFNSVELRSPMLDKQLAEYVYSLPDKYLVSKLKSKRILKDIAHELIPKEILDRPKMGFGVPMSEWLRADLKDLMAETFDRNKLVLENWLDMNVVFNFMERHQMGEDWSRVLWPILALALWVENNI